MLNAGAQRNIRTVILSGNQRIVDKALKLGAEAVLKSASEKDFEKATRLFEDR